MIERRKRLTVHQSTVTTFAVIRPNRRMPSRSRVQSVGHFVRRRCSEIRATGETVPAAPQRHRGGQRMQQKVLAEQVAVVVTSAPPARYVSTRSSMSSTEIAVVHRLDDQQPAGGHRGAQLESSNTCRTSGGVEDLLQWPVEHVSHVLLGHPDDPPRRWVIRRLHTLLVGRARDEFVSSSDRFIRHAPSEPRHAGSAEDATAERSSGWPRRTWGDMLDRAMKQISTPPKFLHVFDDIKLGAAVPTPRC